MYKFKKFKPLINIKIRFINDIIYSYYASNKYVNIYYIPSYMSRKSIYVEFIYKYYTKIYNQYNNAIKFITNTNSIFRFIPDKTMFRYNIYIKLKGIPFITYDSTNDMITLTNCI